MPYDWVVFDADETLFSFDARKGLETLFGRYELDFNEAVFSQFKTVNAPLWQGFQQGKLQAKDIKQRRFVPWESHFGKSSEAINLEFMQCMADVSETIEGTRRLLDTLHGNTRMGIITNGFTELQQERLQKTQTDKYFEFLVVSEEVGMAKPDPEIFHHTHRNHINESVPAERILMVGDNPHSDILGGINAGWHTCWFKRGDDADNSNIEANHTITHLDELTALLANS